MFRKGKCIDWLILIIFSLNINTKTPYFYEHMIPTFTKLICVCVLVY